MAPKEAKRGQKQIDTDNETTLTRYRIVSGAALVIYAIATLWYVESGWLNYIILAITGCLYYGACMMMSSMASQGIDLNMNSGMAEHAKDIIIVTAIIQTLSIISGYFWLLWLIVPGYGFYLLWVTILGPWFFSEPPAEPDEKQLKKMKKMQRVKYR